MIYRNRFFERTTCLLFALLLFASFSILRPGIGEAATAPWTPAPGEAVHREAYVRPLFTEDTVLRNPNSGAAAYLELFPETRIAEAAVLDLWYSYSPIVIPDISTMTVSVNGTPVDSRILKVDGASRSNWSIKLPGNLFRPGANEIEISVVHRTIDGLCRDIDNNANWFIIRPETRLSFVLESAEYTLASFPRPFADPWSASKTDTVVYLPEDFDEETLSAAMNLGSILGHASPSGAFPKRLQVRVGVPEQVEANEIVFGKTSELLPELAEAGQSVSADVPVLVLRHLPNERTRLLIAADDSKAFAKAVMALGRPQIVKTFISDQVVLSSPLAFPPTGVLAELFKDKRQTFTLANFGYAEDIPVTGAFHQEAFIDIPRPPNYRTGDGSYIELHFRHSRILDPRKSAITVYINGIPIRATALTPENADGGVLRAPIPASELNRPSWRVSFGFYHDLGIIDCSKRYDEVAWSVIEKETTVHLNTGKVAYTPVWDSFPNDFYVGGSGRVELTMLLAMENPAQSDFTTAFILAYYIGVHNGNDILWRAKKSADGFDAESAPGTTIALGRNSDAGRWGPLEKYLPVYPQANGYRVAEGLEVVPDVLKDFDVYQIGRVAEGKWLYAFMFKHNSRLNDLLALALALRGDEIPLRGQVSLVDEKGKVTSFLGKAPEPGQEEAAGSPGLASVLDRLGGPDGTAAMYILVLAAVLAVTILVTFLVRKKK